MVCKLVVFGAGLLTVYDPLAGGITLGGGDGVILGGEGMVIFGAELAFCEAA